MADAEGGDARRVDVIAVGDEQGVLTQNGRQHGASTGLMVFLRERGDPFRDCEARGQARQFDSEQVDQSPDAMIGLGLDHEIRAGPPGRAIFGRIPA